MQAKRDPVVDAAARASISVFFPAYNDWGTIASLVVLSESVLRELTDDWEIIVVNDNSPDHVGRILVGNVSHWVVKLAFGLKARDVDCDFRLIRRSVFDRVELTRNSGIICVELVTKVEKNGFRVAHVPVHHYHRMHGRSQFFNFARVARVGRDMFRLWWELIVRKKVTRTGAATAAMPASGAVPAAGGATTADRHAPDPAWRSG